MKKIHLMKKMKSSLTWLCVASMVIGLFAGAGPIVKVTAADAVAGESTDEFAREWTVYEAAEGAELVVYDTTISPVETSGRLEDLGVQLPEGLIEANLNLKIEFTVEGSTSEIEKLNASGDTQFELCNELHDCGELSWAYRSFIVGKNDATFSFASGTHTNHTPVNGNVVEDNKTPFDWEATINYFRFYHTASTSGVKITVNAIKIVYGDHGLVFGDNDTYLKLDNAMDSTPKAVEATINMDTAVADKTWTIHNTGNHFDGVSMSVGSGVTSSAEEPGEGMNYLILNASSTASADFAALETDLEIDASAFSLDELSLNFWVYSSEAGKLDDDYNSHIRLDSDPDGEEDTWGNFLFWYPKEIDVKVGWNYIKLPLNTAKTDVVGQFQLDDICTWHLTSFSVPSGRTLYFGDVELVATNSGQEIAGEGEWILRSGANTSYEDGTLTTGVTNKGDAPGSGMTYHIMDNSAATSVKSYRFSNTKLNINTLGDYKLSRLSIGFWVYSSATGTLGDSTQDNQMRISSNSEGVGSKFLYYSLNKVQVCEGWNWVEIPLTDMVVHTDDEGGVFDVASIQSFGFNTFYVPAGEKRCFGDFKLILSKGREWLVHTGTHYDEIQNQSALGCYTTTASDVPGAGMRCTVFDASSSDASVSFGRAYETKKGIDAGMWTIDDLSLCFWVYAEKAGGLGNSTSDSQLWISSNEANAFGNGYFWYMSKIEVEAGWNYVELPLNDPTTAKTDLLNDFILESINSVGFVNYVVPAGQKFYYGDFKLVAKYENAWDVTDENTTYGGTAHERKTVNADDVYPEAGMTYVASKQNAYTSDDANDGKFGLDLYFDGFDVSKDPSRYDVGFWFYTSTGQIPNGQIELNGEGGCVDTKEITYYPQSQGVKKGWNYIKLNLAQKWEVNVTDVNYENINYMRWYSDNGAQVTKDTIFGIGDIELLKDDEVIKTLAKAENIPLRYGLNDNKSIYTAEAGPSVGETYIESTIGAGNTFSLYTTGLNAINASEYAASELELAFWLYVSSPELTAGQLELTSNGSADNEEWAWDVSVLDNNLQPGWNYISLPLDSKNYTTNGDLDLSSINFTRMYIETGMPLDTVLRIGEMKLYATSTREGSENNIKTTTNANSVSGQYMIFSNANIAKETNPYALFVTPEGYLGVLYGTTQFILEEDVCTGEDVQIKVVRANSGIIKFYIDDELAGKTETKVTALGAPKKSYRIGADGKGNQIFKGTIKDVKVYSDASATTCVGNWPLIGDKKYVTETMPDVSGNGNDAYFAGSRADDWYDVEAADASAGEWSLVYIPDTSQRFYNKQHSLYHKMAEWIAEDVTTLKHDNIKYVVGDQTNDPAQADAANAGYELMETSVPNSNLNDKEHSYYRFQAGDGVKWLIISLNVYDGAAAYTYQKEIMNQYPADNVIVVADKYTSAIVGELDESMKSRVKLIISDGIAEDDAVADGVPSMCLPAWDDEENTYFAGEQHLGLLYVLRFTDNGTKVTARSYAPVYGKYFKDIVTTPYGTMSISTETEVETQARTYTTATGGTEPSDVPVGYKFAGWYKVYNEGLEQGLAYSIYDASAEAQTFKTENYGLNIKPTAYTTEQLAVEFWVYASETGKMATGDNHLRISSSTDGIGANWLYWPVQEIDVKEGWNHISLPLSKWKQGTGGEFNKNNIQRIGFEPLLLPTGTYRYITDIELVAYVADEVSRKWTLRSGNDTTTKTGQTLETGETKTFEKPLAKGTTASNVYAKFVDADVLGVKAQVKTDACDKSNYTNIRFLTSVDSLDYREMGFKVTFVNPYKGPTDKDTRTYAAHKYVYENILAMDETGSVASYKANSIFSADSKYFKAFTIKNVPNWAFSEEFTVQPYWVTLDGTTIYGDAVDKSVWKGYPTEYEYLPKIVDTTYETEDVVIAEIIPTVEKYGYEIDPTGEVDCTAELQRALDDCHDMGGGTVYLPAGTYKISDSIDIPAYVTLRGDYNDPDKTNGTITNYGTVFNIYPTVQVSANRNDDSAHNSTASFIMHGSSGVVGITAYYPNQVIGAVIEYPYTFYVQNNGIDNQLITLKNITVINGYRGVGTSYKMQHEQLIIDNFKGSFIDCGLALYNSSDTGRVTGVTISRKYWAGYKEIDEKDVPVTAVGMELGDLEWDLFSNCTINGCTTGISIVGGWRANFAGSMIDMTISDCTTGITVADENADPYEVNTNDAKQSTYPLIKALDPRWGMVIARSSISANGNAIENNSMPVYEDGFLGIGEKITRSSALIRLSGVTIPTGEIASEDYVKVGYFNSVTKNVLGESETIENASSYTAKYEDSYVITEAQRKNLWVLDLEEYDGTGEDVSGLINDAMTDVLERNSEGGILYIPGGTYCLDNPIEVAQGVELRGASGVATREQYDNCEGTLFMCYYGDDSSSSITDTALITLAGDNSGVNGVKFLYPQNVITYNADTNSTYTIEATGANVHVVNTYIAASSYGVNLENCKDFYVESLYTCCYLNAINASNSSGIIRGCTQNPNMIARTRAKGLTDNWPVETDYSSSAEDYPIIQIRNDLMTDLRFITISGMEEHTVLVQDALAYAVNTLITNNGATVTAINTNADAMYESGKQFYLQSGSLTAINALRACIDIADGSSRPANLYVRDEGTLHIYNPMTPCIEGEENESAYEPNI